MKRIQFNFSRTRRFGFSNYSKEYQKSIRDPIGFWNSQIHRIPWFQKPTRILDDSQSPFMRWFSDGQLNLSYCALDQHLPYNSDKVAIHHISPMTNTDIQVTYKELHDKVSRLAGGLRNSLGIRQGDRIIIYMPMIPEAVAAMLSCTRIGAIHCVVFGGFSAVELGNRIKDSDAKAVITCSFGMEGSKKILYKPIVDQAIELSGVKGVQTVVFNRNLNVDCDWDMEKLIQTSQPIDAVPVLANHPAYIIYTSCTTGSPKGIVRDTGGMAISLDYCLDRVLDIHRNDVLFSASDIGWVVGHSFCVYGPLIRGASTVIYEGKPIGTHDSSAYWRIIEGKRVKHLYTSPTALRVLRNEDPEGKFIKQYDISSLQSLSFAGERCDVPTYKWAQQHFPQCFLNDNYWQTETGWPIISNFRNLEQFKGKPGSATKPVPGFNIKILAEDGQEKEIGQMGQLCVNFPTPPSFALTIWGRDDDFIAKYFNNKLHYQTGDIGFKDEDGYYHIMTRLDDLINTAGHRLSTSQMEEVLMHHPSVSEAIVVGVRDKIKGEVPVGFVTLKQSITQDKSQIQNELIMRIRNDIGPVASFKTCIIVDKLPKTRSSKYLRTIIRSMCNNQTYKIPATIEDPSVLEPLEKIIKQIFSSQSKEQIYKENI